MNKVLITLLLFVSSNLFATEYIVEVKKGHTVSQTLKNQSLRQFQLLGQTYVVVSENNKSLKSLKEVSRVEENFEVHAFSEDFFTPTVTDFKKQWGLHNEGHNEPVSLDRMSPLDGVKGADVNILKAWKITKGSSDVVVAVIDTGVKWNHPELRENMWVNQAEKNGKKGVDDDGNGFIDDIYGYDFVKNDSDPMDEYGHGTHCAGIIGASHKTGRVAGVMANVSIMAVRMMDHRGRGSLEQSLKALAYAVENGANVLSNSWGSRGNSEIMEGIFRKANEKGIVVVAAAGNARFNDNDVSPTYPATYPVSNIISVAAFNAQERHSAYSSFGKKTVHVSAPGTNVISTFIKKGRRQKEIYKVSSGTSMAAPFVSGLVGLFMSHSKMKLTPEEIRQRLIDSAVPAEEMQDMNVAGGRVDAYQFLTL